MKPRDIAPNGAGLPTREHPLIPHLSEDQRVFLHAWAVKRRMEAAPGPEDRAALAKAAAALRAAMKPAPAEAILDRIAALALHYPARPLTDAQAERLAADWIADLGHLPADILDAACRDWRRSANGFAPTPGQLLALADPIFRGRAFYLEAAERLLDPKVAVLAPRTPAR